LYNLETGPDESYDVAAANPAVVARIEEQIAALLRTFPEPVRRAWAEAKARPVDANMSTGAYPNPSQARE